MSLARAPSAPSASPRARAAATMKTTGRQPSSSPLSRARAVVARASDDATRCALTTSVIASTLEDARRDVRDAVEKGADIVELRVDFLGAADRVADALEALIDACPVPVIVTYRPTWEGGQYDGDESERLATLWRAHELGAAYVDCEVAAAERFFAAKPASADGKTSPTKIILSSHNYEETPSDEELRRIHDECLRAGADIVKSS